ncbi:MAG TPA: hypothetical protein VGY53_11780, partial [Isosphaeraceae bacterium]|nr:hypothetical protein [Isosphaeraceae bacterium]
MARQAGLRSHRHAFAISPLRRATMIPWAIAALLALGWTTHEIAHANNLAELVASQTVTLDRVMMNEASYDGKRTGMIGFYVQG